MNTSAIIRTYLDNGICEVVCDGDGIPVSMVTTDNDGSASHSDGISPNIQRRESGILMDKWLNRDHFDNNDGVIGLTYY